MNKTTVFPRNITGGFFGFLLLFFKFIYDFNEKVLKHSKAIHGYVSEEDSRLVQRDGHVTVPSVIITKLFFHTPSSGKKHASEDI